MGGEADAELSHHFAGGFFAVAEAAGDGEGELEVAFEGGALLGDGGLGGGLACEHLAGLAEDPRVTDAAAGDADRAHSGVADHEEDVFGGPDVAAAEDEFGGVFGAEVFEKGPAAGADVLLLDGAGVHCCEGVAHVVGGVEDGVEVVDHLRGVVEGPADFEGADDVGRDGFADGFQDFDRAFGFGEPVAAAGFLFDLLDGAGEVDVDDFEGAFGVGARMGVWMGVGEELLLSADDVERVAGIVSAAGGVVAEAFGGIELDRGGWFGLGFGGCEGGVGVARVGEHSVGLLGAGALLDHLDGSRGHLAGVAAHDLAGEGGIFDAAGDVVVEVTEIGFVEAAAAGEEGAV